MQLAKFKTQISFRWDGLPPFSPPHPPQTKDTFKKMKVALKDLIHQSTRCISSLSKEIDAFVEVPPL